MSVPKPEHLGRWRVLHADRRRVYASRGYVLYESSDGGRTFERVAAAPVSTTEGALAAGSITSRLLRAGLFGVEPAADGSLVAIARRRILHLEAGSQRFAVAHRVTRGTRPLRICRTPTGPLYFGEYFGNPERDQVHVYGSDDGGRSWSVAHTFPAGSIRHVHAVHWDPWRLGVWVLTGDDGDEAGLWWTSDGFRTLDPVLRGDQRARAIGMLPTQEGIVVPMDSPTETNRVNLFDPRTGRMDELATLPGSAFFASRARGVLLVSTAVEAKGVNADPRVALYASADGTHWEPVARFERDLAWLHDKRGYLQLPALVLPTGEEADAVLATGQALAGLHGQLLRWPVDELIRWLRARSAAA